MSVSTPNKLSLLLLCLAVAALLAPYAGCNELTPESDKHSDHSTAERDRRGSSRPAESAGRVPKAEEPRDPIEDILSN